MTPARSCELRRDDRVVGQLGRPLEGPLRLPVGGERGGPLARADEHLAGALSDRGRVGGVRRRLEGVEVVGGDDLDDLVLLAARRRGEERGSGEVLRLAVARESVSYATRLTMSCRNAYWPRSGERGSAWTESISLRSERREQRLELRLGETGQRARALAW